MIKIINFLKHAPLLRHPEFIVDNIISLDPNTLKQQNTTALILDFDGVLAPEGDLHPLPEVIEWLEKALQVFGSQRLFILSNNPLPARKLFFEQYFNNQIIFIIAKPKPDPQGIMITFNTLKAKNATIEKSQILLIDDRLSTGILAAKIFGVASCLIRRPYVNLKNNFFREFLFICLRTIERISVWRL